MCVVEEEVGGCCGRGSERVLWKKECGGVVNGVYDDYLNYVSLN